MKRVHLVRSLEFLFSGLLFLGACGSDSAEPVEPPEVLGVNAAADSNPDPNIVEVELTAGQFTGTLGGDVELSLMGYNGGAPGPLIQAFVGDEIIVHFRNDLDQPTTIHWHGLRISSEMDGTPRVQEPVEPGETFTYRFVAPEAGTFWYHPHVRGFEQVERGLYGPIVIHSVDDPAYDAERYIMLDDIYLDDAGQIAPFLTSHFEQMHGRIGNEFLTNGQLADPLQLTAEQGAVERWRLVNTSNARTMEISLAGASFRVIATDGGLLQTPYVTDRLQIAVGQRYDLEVTYRDAGKVELLSHVLVLDENDEVVEKPFPVAQVDVAASEAQPRAIEWPTLQAPVEREIDDTVTVTFDAVQGANGLEWRINGVANREEPLYVFGQGQTVRMILNNQAGPEHPFHLHGQFFEVLSDAQPGLKDTVLVPGQSKVGIIAYFDNPGRWMAHCHILEHAELGMMSEIVVEPVE